MAKSKTSELKWPLEGFLLSRIEEAILDVKEIPEVMHRVIVNQIVDDYCHCKEPLKVKHYKIGGAMPLIIMGIITSIIGLIIGDGGVLIFGILFTLAASGDMIALYI